VEKELRNLEKFEQQATKLTEVEAKYKALLERMNNVDEQHRQDIRIIKEEYQEQINFLKDELKAWRSWHQKQE
jgi:archaellum component FlaC